MPNTTKKKQHQRATPTPASPSPPQQLPSNVKFITIQLPVYVGEFPGYDGGDGRVEVRLGRGAAQALQRVMLAQMELLNTNRVAGIRGGDLVRPQCVRAVFRCIEDAIKEVM